MGIIPSIKTKLDTQDNHFDIVLSDASMVMAAMIEQLRAHTVAQEDDQVQESLFGTLYLAEMAKALLASGQEKAMHELCKLEKGEAA